MSSRIFLRSFHWYPRAKCQARRRRAKKMSFPDPIAAPDK